MTQGEARDSSKKRRSWINRLSLDRKVNTSFHEISPLNKLSEFFREPEVPHDSFLRSAKIYPELAVINDSNPVEFVTNEVNMALFGTQW